MSFVRIFGLAFSFFFACSLVCAANAPPLPDATSSSSEAPHTSPVIVIGFLGGFVHRDNIIHSEVQVAAHLRADYSATVHAETFENHEAGEAYKKVLSLLDANHDGILTDDEKRNARIIVYGHSWGGSETVKLARELQEINIPVLLTIQVDSVQKLGENDEVIPNNVGEAANFYQPHGILHGRSQIRAADPRRTKILGNFELDYEKNPVACAKDYPWWDRHITKPHTLIECDPRVWNRLETMIRGKLPRLTSATRSEPAAGARSAWVTSGLVLATEPGR
jgi:hypothetical protein